MGSKVKTSSGKDVKRSRGKGRGDVRKGVGDTRTQGYVSQPRNVEKRFWRQ